MVKKKVGPKDILICLGASVLAALILFIGLMLTPVLPMLPFLVLCGVVYGLYWVISSRSVEYEYSITNGDIAVDKITNRRSRKRLTSFDAKAIEEMGKYTENAQKLRGRRVDKTFFRLADRRRQGRLVRDREEPQDGPDAARVLAGRALHRRDQALHGPPPEVRDFRAQLSAAATGRRTGNA